MGNESTPSHRVLNPLPDIDFDVRDPNGWYRSLGAYPRKNKEKTSGKSCEKERFAIRY